MVIGANLEQKIDSKSYLGETFCFFNTKKLARHCLLCLNAVGKRKPYVVSVMLMFKVFIRDLRLIF